jgi:hypothetical protein
MLDFRLRLLNFPIEHFLNPKKRLSSKIIGIRIWKLLPLKEESFQDITEKTDCLQILNSIDGTSFDNLSDLKEFIQGDEFYLSDVAENKDAYTLSLLSTTLKYLFLSKRLLQILVAEDTAFSFQLPYLAEATQDIEASLYLMKGGYFKQSLQTLRNVLEVTLLHPYLALNYLDHEDLREVMKQKHPAIKEIIVNLRQFGLLTNKMEQQYFDLYRSLSLAVHSEVTKLTVYNDFSNKHSFSEWYSSFVEVLELKVRTILRMVEIGI